VGAADGSVPEPRAIVESVSQVCGWKLRTLEERTGHLVQDAEGGLGEGVLLRGVSGGGLVDDVVVIQILAEPLGVDELFGAIAAEGLDPHVRPCLKTLEVLKNMARMFGWHRGELEKPAVLIHDQEAIEIERWINRFREVAGVVDTHQLEWPGLLLTGTGLWKGKAL